MEKSVLYECRELIQKEIDLYSEFLKTEIDVQDENTFRIAGTGIFRALLFEDGRLDYSAVEEAKLSGAFVYVKNRRSPVCKKCDVRKRCTCLSEMVLPIYLSKRYLGAVCFLVYDEAVFQKMTIEPGYYKEKLEHLSSVLRTAAEQYLKTSEAENYRALLTDVMEQSASPVLYMEDGWISKMNAAAESYFGSVRDEDREKRKVHPGIRATVYASRQENDVTLKAGSMKFDLPAHHCFRPSDMPFKKRLETLVIKKDQIPGTSVVQNDTVRVTMDYLEGKSICLTDFKRLSVSLYNTNRFMILEGERGIGKETWARAIHHASRFADREFVVFDCNEFFDFNYAAKVFDTEKGIFSRKNITVCFKEVSKLSSWIQRKIADSVNIMTANNIRVIATTTESPDELLKQNALHNRFYMIFYPAFIRVPALRERTEDVDFYIRDCIDKFTALEKEKVRFTPKALQLLRQARWPGNFKQMEQTVGFLISLNTTGVVTDEDVFLLPDFANDTESLNLAGQEKRLIEEALSRYAGPNGKNLAAKALGISKATLYRKIREYGIG